MGGGGWLGNFVKAAESISSDIQHGFIYKGQLSLRGELPHFNKIFRVFSQSDRHHPGISLFNLQAYNTGRPNHFHFQVK